MAICAAAMTAIATPAWLIAQSKTPATWKRGVEGQRQAISVTDSISIRYSRAIARSSVVRDGTDYYMVHSSFENYPGLLVWRSRDLVNWALLTTTNVGIIWAPDIVKHNGRSTFTFPPGATGTVRTSSSGPIESKGRGRARRSEDSAD